MGLASSAGVFPLAVVGDSVRCAETGVSVTPTILPSSDGSDSGVSLPARPTLCPATSQPTRRFELATSNVPSAVSPKRIAVEEPVSNARANIGPLSYPSRKTFPQLFPKHSHAISWKSLLREVAWFLRFATNGGALKAVPLQGAVNASGLGLY